MTAIALEQQACSFIYGVHDGGRNNSQFFRYSDEIGFEALGPVYRGYDIEGLDISSDQVLYATSGDNTDNPGYLYTVDMNTGAILTARPIGDCKEVDGIKEVVKEVDGISVNPVTGDLWGWSQDKGLILITETDCTVLVPNPKGFEVEDLSWNNAGNMIYFPYNAHAGGLEKDDANATHHIGKYDKITGEIDWNLCDIQAREIEAIEVLQNDSLLIGFHENGQQFAMRFDPTSCHILTEDITAAKYTDIEGIAEGIADCPSFFRAIADCAPTHGTAPLTVHCTANGEDPNGTIEVYRWDWENDGIWDTYDTVAQDYDHTYYNSGVYNAVLMVESSTGGTATASIPITVDNNPPKVMANVTPSNGGVPLNVTLAGSATDADGNIVLYEWDAEGDGTYEYSSNTSGTTHHTYTVPGTYQAVFRALVAVELIQMVEI
jgi:hypothetical protein